MGILLLAASSAQAAPSILGAPLVAEPFTQVDYLPPCGSEKHVLMSADGTSAVWGRCRYTHENGEWLPTGEPFENFQHLLALAFGSALGVSDGAGHSEIHPLVVTVRLLGSLK